MDIMRCWEKTSGIEIMKMFQKGKFKLQSFETIRVILYIIFFNKFRINLRKISKISDHFVFKLNHIHVKKNLF